MIFGRYLTKNFNKNTKKGDKMSSVNCYSIGLSPPMYQINDFFAKEKPDMQGFTENEVEMVKNLMKSSIGIMDANSQDSHENCYYLEPLCNMVKMLVRAMVMRNKEITEKNLSDLLYEFANSRINDENEIENFVRTFATKNSTLDEAFQIASDNQMKKKQEDKDKKDRLAQEKEAKKTQKKEKKKSKKIKLQELKKSFTVLQQDADAEQEEAGEDDN
jgi:hypothetical protein